MESARTAGISLDSCYLPHQKTATFPRALPCASAAFISGSGLATPALADSVATDKAALTAFYNATGGAKMYRHGGVNWGHLWYI